MDKPRSKAPVTNRAPLSSHIKDQLLEIGKLPPQATDLEEAVLGALMLEKDALTDVIDILKPEVFYKDEHVRIFAAIQRIFQRSEPVDILTVTAELKKSGELEMVGGAYYISWLTNRVASSANSEFHARIILQKHIQRELIRISSKTIKDAFEDTSDALDLLDNAEKNLFEISQGNIRKNYDEMSLLIKRALDEIDAARKNSEGLVGVPSGFTALDRVTSGWQRSDLLILAARPGMGKTAFVLNIARNAAVDHKRPVAFFTLEMSSLQLITRMISSETELPFDKLKKGNLEPYEYQQLQAKIGSIADAPIYIDDTPALSIFELRAKARRLKAEKKIELIIIDYLQLMTSGVDSKSGNREQEISNISRSLKSIAKELDIPVIALSQLSRAVETRGGTKRPQLSDLRESGAIEQDADLVVFLYRPDYYGLDVNEKGDQIADGYTEVIIAKHRNGALEDVPLRFVKRLAKFVDFSSGEINALGEGNTSKALGPGTDFLDINPNAITKSSRMNDIEEEPPF